MISSRMKKTGSYIFFLILSAVIFLGFLFIINHYFSKLSFTEIVSRPVTIQAPLVLVTGGIMIIFLFIINLLVTANTQKKKEEQINTAKSEFITLVSHQLRTPLSAINWYIESLLGDKSSFPAEKLDYLEKIQGSGQRMNTLINSMLDVSRLELNTFVTDVQMTDMNALVGQVIGELQHIIDTKKIIFTQRLGDQLTTVALDPRYIRIVLDNLLSNAFKYTPQGGKVDLVIEHTGDNLHIKISDTGYGIPKKEQEKVFTKLFRGGNIITKDTDGNGLGLYIVKLIITSAQGNIWFESVEGKGTTFFITLPIT